MMTNEATELGYIVDDIKRRTSGVEREKLRARILMSSRRLLAVLPFDATHDVWDHRVPKRRDNDAIVMRFESL